MADIYRGHCLAPQPTLSFPIAGELLLAVNRGKRPWQPCTTGGMWKFSSHIQGFRIFLLMHFLFSHSVSFFFLSLSFFLLLFIPACPLSFGCCCCFSFPFPPFLFLLPTAFLSYFSFYLCIFPPLSSPTLSASAPRLFLSFQCFPLFYTLIPPLAPSP